MTSHSGRKTAGVMLLNRGIRMETVSRALGYSSVRMTEKVYGKLIDRTVADEFDAVFGRVAPEPESYMKAEGGRVVPLRFAADGW